MPGYRLAMALVCVLHAGTASAGEKAIGCRDSTPSEIFEIAADYLRGTRPDRDDYRKLPPVLNDRGESWEVTYELPPGTLGGTSAVLINKGTCRPTKAFSYQ